MPFFDIAVIGGGHAGIEASFIGASLGLKIAFITADKNKLGYPSCNPSIGGIAKSHLVFELDVFGAMMPQTTDKTSIHSKLLNSSKGPAVWSLRSQIDSTGYPKEAARRISSFPNIELIEDEAVNVAVKENRAVGVVCEKRGLIEAKGIVLATGTFLNGVIFIGRESFKAGRYGEPSSVKISESLVKMNIGLMRLKTGTPARAYRSSIDFSKLEVQDGEDDAGSFSILSKDAANNVEKCFIGRTNPLTHEIIRKNLHLSALYSGLITGVGPKYCPSIEDKVVRFEGRDSHNVFIEPMGKDSELVYINGTSSSLPEEVQYEFLRTINGLERIKFSQPGYAIEYDAIKSRQLKPTLETKRIENLFMAGQINGTSGYEEAASQGFVAGLNCALKALGREEIIFDRYTSYIGVLTDDITKKEIKDPYRLFTSRAENRLALRQDNNFIRLLKSAERINLMNDSVNEYKKLYEEYSSMSNNFFDDEGFLRQKHRELNDPSRSFEDFRKIFPQNSRRAALALYSEIKYAGYIERYRKVTRRILECGDLSIKNKELLLSSAIVSKEAKEILTDDRIEKIKDLYGRIDPSDIENIVFVIKKRV